MFTTFRRKLILVGFIILVLSVPVGSYLLSQRQTISSKASTPKDRTITKLEPLPDSAATPSPPAGSPREAGGSPSPSPAASVSFGPTMNLKVILEGRPQQKYATQLFVGVAEGKPLGTPNYLLQFTVDLPSTGVFQGLSLAGLNPGLTYTAYLKDPSHIATSSAFAMVPTVTNLNEGAPLTLLAGDLNEDNIINSADFAIAKGALGASSSSKNWNATADFNLDGIINSLDLSYIIKNFTKTGESGVWISPAPKGSATSSAMPSGSPAGYWLWMPGI